MDVKLCLEVAGRIDVLLRRVLGQGIEPRRMMIDALYARDVLLVCDALHGSDAPQLSQQFRAARRTALAVSDAAPLAPRPAAQAPRASASRWLSSMFGNSGPPTTLSPPSVPSLPSLVSQPGDLPGPLVAGPRARRWLGWARGGAK